jgi:hypothetical protein
MEDDLDAIIFNPVVLPIPIWRTFRLPKRMKNFHLSTRDHEVLCADRPSEYEQILIRPLFQQKEEEGGRLKFKIHILFYGDNS